MSQIGSSEQALESQSLQEVYNFSSLKSFIGTSTCSHLHYAMRFRVRGRLEVRSSLGSEPLFNTKKVDHAERSRYV